jgi:Sortase domain
MRKAGLTAVAVAGVLAAAAVVSLLVGSGSPRPAGTPTPSRTARPLVRSLATPPGSPELIAIPAIGVDSAVGSVVSTYVQGLWEIIPPLATDADLQRVYWWSEHAAPANPSKGTSYIYGHACTHYALCTFNRLDELGIGDLVWVTTVRGILEYRVVGMPIRLAKTADGIGASSIYNYSVVNRLVLITCAYAPDGSSPWNWAVITQLVAAAPTPQP